MKFRLITAALLAGLLVISAYHFHGNGNQTQLLTPATTSTPISQVTLPSGATNNVVSLATSTNLLSLGDIKRLANPNIGKVDYYPIQNSKGTVILIPQQHQNPGTDPSDPINDLAVATQKEIYGILKDLTGKLNINVVMAEGDMFGAVPDNKIKYLTNLISLHARLASSIDALQKDGDPITDQLLNDLRTYERSIEREITLTGAPYDLKAEGNSLVIYGIENKNTFDRSATLVRNYVYLLDRKQQLTSGTKNQMGAGLTKAIVYPPTQSLDPAAAIIQKISFFPSFILTKATNAALSDIGGVLSKIQQLKAVQNTNAAALPSRSANPYSSLTSAAEVDKLIEQNNADIQKTIIDQRNIDTADNCLQVLTEKNTPSLILQLGAGHEEGIVKDLNAKGLSVIVITPRSVLKS
jgi:hypothetical protein